jgi:hypothetical protein
MIVTNRSNPVSCVPPNAYRNACDTTALYGVRYVHVYQCGGGDLLRLSLLLLVAAVRLPLPVVLP